MTGPAGDGGAGPERGPPARSPDEPRTTRRGRWSDVRAMALATAGRCPNCGRGRMFASFYRLKDTCPVCGVRFERDTGSWLGASVLAYIVAIVMLMVEAAVLIPIWGLFRGLEWVLVGTAVVVVLAVYRPVKGWWVWWMWAAGFVTRDRNDAGGG